MYRICKYDCRFAGLLHLFRERSIRDAPLTWKLDIIQGVAISLKNWSWHFEQIWAESWPFGGEMRKGIQIKTIRNLNLDHLGGNAESWPSGGEMREMRRLIPPKWSRFGISPQMVKIQVPDGFHPDLSPHFPPKWSRFGSNLLKMPVSILEADGTTCYIRIELPWSTASKTISWQ